MPPPLLAGLAAGCVLLGAAGAWLLLAGRPGAARLELDAGRANGRRRGSPLGRLLDAAGGRLARPVLRLLGAERQQAVRAWLEAAGRPGGYDLAGFVGRAALFALLGAAAAAVQALAGNWPLAALLAVGPGLLLPAWVAAALRRRQAAIERALPDFLDILAVTVGAGLSLRAALDRVAEAHPGPLADEIRTALRQMEVGVSRRRALEQLRGRNRSPTLASFVTALLQAEELGAPLSATLIELSRELRRAWHQEARRRAARAAPRVSLVAVVTLVPGSAVLLVAGLLLGALRGAGSALAP